MERMAKRAKEKSDKGYAGSGRNGNYKPRTFSRIPTVL